MSALGRVLGWLATTLKPPAGEEPSPRPTRATPPTARAPLPGHIPPPDVTHPGKVVRLAVVYDCGGGYCGWVWRPDHGWKHQHTCTPDLPTADQWDWWGAHLWETR